MPRLRNAFKVWPLLLACACPRGGVVRAYPPPDAQEVVAHIAGVRERVSSLNAATRTDVRLGQDRVNLSVDILAGWGGRLRFQAHDPNDATAADLASDGTTYCFLNAHDNCGECGPATAASVSRMIGLVMAPDDVVAALLGSTPLIPAETARVSWDPDTGREILTLTGGGFIQRVELDGRDRRWDVLDSELVDPRGKSAWRLRHKDFRGVLRSDGATVRLPGRSLFEQAGESVRILWREQAPGYPLRGEMFKLEVPAGLPSCDGEPR